MQEQEQEQKHAFLRWNSASPNISNDLKQCSQIHTMRVTTGMLLAV
jgi:hypothetical protein